MARPKKTPEEIEIGDLVRHPKWGEGTVLSKTGKGEETKVVVVFPEAGQKKLLVKYARLRKVELKKVEEDEISEEEFEPEIEEEEEELEEEEEEEEEEELEEEEEEEEEEEDYEKE